SRRSRRSTSAGPRGRIRWSPGPGSRSPPEPDVRAVNVLVVGGTGFVGSALARLLTQRGHRVSLLSRRPSAPRALPPVYHWDPEREELDPNALAGIEAVVNLAGENLAGVRWTPERKRRLVSSRVD